MSSTVRWAGRIALSVASLIVCCGLAWWQWDRFQSASGTFQNLGYVLQWPLFGLFPAFMFYRMHRLRQAELADPGEAPERPEPSEPQEQTVAVRQPTITEPTGDEADDELAAYNRYLRDLNARDARA